MRPFHKNIDPAALIITCAVTLASLFASCQKEDFAEADFSYTLTELRQTATFVWTPSADGTLRCPDQTLSGVTVTSSNQVNLHVSSSDEAFSGVQFASSNLNAVRILEVEKDGCRLAYAGDGDATITMTAGSIKKTVKVSALGTIPLKGVTVTVGGRPYLIPVGTDGQLNFVCISPDGNVPAEGGEELVITGLDPENSSYRQVEDFKGASLESDTSLDEVNREHYGEAAPVFCKDGHETNLDFASIQGRKLFFDHEAISRGSFYFKFFNTECYAEVSYFTKASWEEEEPEEPEPVVDGLAFLDSFDPYPCRKMSYEFEEYERVFRLRIGNRNNASIAVEISEEGKDWLEYRNVPSKVDEYYVHVSESAQEGPRTATITFHESGCMEGEGCTLTVTQKGPYGYTLRKGLTDLYNTCNGPKWLESENWCSDKPLFEWYGISAKDTMSLSIFGADRKAYFGTGDLWTIWFGGNNNVNQGVVPEGFWRACEHFEAVHLRSNYLPDSEVPDYIWSFPNLSCFDIYETYMKASLDSVANAKSLVTLNLSRCKINSTIPESLTSMPWLTDINLSCCGLKGTIPSDMGKLKYLMYLELGGNPDIEGTIPESLYELENLRSIDVSDSRIGGTLPLSLLKLERLYSFDVSNCEFEGPIPEEYGSFKRGLMFLDGNYFEAIPQFARFKGLNEDQYFQAGGFPSNIPFFQRPKSFGRPENFVGTHLVVNHSVAVDGVAPTVEAVYCDYDENSGIVQLPMPEWAYVRFGDFKNWTRARSFKYPEYPYADDLQYPVNEYYFDTESKEWRHPKLEYPVREYYCNFDTGEWIHDASCPWEKEHISDW